MSTSWGYQRGMARPVGCGLLCAPMTNTADAARLATARPVAALRARMRWPPLRRLLRDPFVGQAVLLAVPIAILAQGGAGRPQVVAAVVATFVVGQAALAMTTRRIYARRHVSVSMGRLLVNVAFVASGQVVVGDASILALAYLPLVSAAASFGARQAVAVGTVAVALQGLIETLHRAPEGDALHRTLVFASVALLVGMSTRLEVGRLHHARVRMREAVTGDRRRAKQIAGVETIGRILATDGPTGDALDRVVARISSELGYRYVAIYLGGQGGVRLGSQRGYPQIVDTFDGTRGIVGRVMRTGRPALVSDVRADPDYLELDPDVQSEICVPLTAEGEFLGFVNVESTAQSLDITDLRLMVAVADRLAAALTTGRDRQRLTERADLFRHLHDFSEGVNGTLEPAQLYRAIVRGIPRVVPADIAELVVLDRATGRYLLVAMDGAPGEEYVGVEVRPGEGMAGRAIRDRALVVDEQFGRPAFARSVATAGDPALSPMQAASAPLVREGAVVGAITVLRRDCSQRFTQLERDALAMIAEQVALGVANAFLHADVRELAVRDPLTGLFNRRYLDPALNQLMAQRARLPESERPALSVVMYDFDHFSELNNRHGHQAGDAVLRTFGAMLLARRRSSDVVARFGGEEFAMVLYRATLDDAVRIAEQVREQVAGQPVEGPNGEELSVTVSAGCATAGAEAPTAEALLRAADVALYMAKRAGRNRVVAA